MRCSSVETALQAFARGEMLVLADDQQGYLALSAARVTPEAVGFMVRHTSGLLRVSLPEDRLDALDLPLMVPTNTEAALTVSVDARSGTSTGVSAADRATTIRVLVDDSTRPDDLVRPGHVFPVRYRPGGVLKRAGAAEAAVDLAHLAGLAPAGVVAEVTLADGSLARRAQLEAFAAACDLGLISIADVVAYRRAREPRLVRVATTNLSTSFGEFASFAFESLEDGQQHLAMVRGDVSGSEPVPVCVHAECIAGDVFGARGCTCGEQLQASLRAISDARRGVVVYLRGHALNRPHEASLADREFATATDILRCLGVKRVQLLTDDPRNCSMLADAGAHVVERIWPARRAVQAAG